MDNFFFKSRSEQETAELGALLGSLILKKAAVALSGDLGAGKTVFVQGLARGLEVPSDFYVTSPTFNIINEYPGRLPLFHLDLYRIIDSSELLEIGFFELVEAEEGVVAVEWAQKLERDFFTDVLWVEIRSTGDMLRNFSLSAKGACAKRLAREFEERIKEMTWD